MIVVASSTSYLCATKSSIARSSSSSAICPWPTTMRASGTSRVIRLPMRVDRLDAVVDEVDLPAALQLRADRPRDDRPDRTCTTLVWIDSRSFGGVSMIDMSRMPTSDMFSVRGIGVAVIVSTSTRLRICLMRSLCATPKRCSSSTTSSPRSRNSTSFESSRCVPTMMSTLPAARSSSVCLLLGLRAEAADHVDADGERREPLAAASSGAGTPGPSSARGTRPACRPSPP